MALLKKYCGFIFLLSVVLVEATPDCRIAGYEGPLNYVRCTPTHDYNYILRRGLVSDNRRTSTVSLRGCRISHVTREAFKNMPALKFVDLSVNQISELPFRIFDENIELKALNISYNSLTELSFEFFDDMRYLIFLDLHSNKITLEPGIFDALWDLRALDLSNNSITGRDLSPSLFRENEKMSVIYFSRNYMNGAPDNLLYPFKALESLYLVSCYLSEVPLFATRRNLRTLKHLSLSKNEISRLENNRIFENLFNLKVLDLSYNGLEYIDANTFKPLRNLKSILLNNNKLSSLPDSLFQQISNLQEIDLANNQLSTVSATYFSGTPLSNLNLANNRITYLSEKFCHKLITLGVRLKSFGFYNNPWQCSCLKPVLDEVKKYNIAYNGAAYDGRHPVCVTTNEYTCKRNLNRNGIKLYTDMYDSLNISHQADTWFIPMPFNKKIDI